MTRRWIRLDATWHESKWLADLPWASRAAWPLVLGHIKVSGIGGRCRAPLIGRLAAGLDVPVECLEECIRAAIEHGAMTEQDGEWTVVKWHEYQTPDDSAERVARHRNARRNGVTPLQPVTEDGNGGVSELLCRVTETETKTKTDIPPTPPAGGRRTRFAPPSLEEACAYAAELGMQPSSAEEFRDYFESKGWKVGTAPMKDWRAAMRNWQRRDRTRAAPPPPQGRYLTPEEAAI